MEPDDLSPTLGGGPVDWKFEERRHTTTFRMPTDVERDRQLLDELENHYERRARAIISASASSYWGR